MKDSYFNDRDEVIEKIYPALLDIRFTSFLSNISFDHKYAISNPEYIDTLIRSCALNIALEGFNND